MPERVFVEGSPQLEASVPAQTSVGDTAGMVLLPNARRKGLLVQNTGTTTIKLSLGTDLPSQTVYTVALKACAVADDGSGGVYVDESWVGQVNAISSVAGGTCIFVEYLTGSPDWNASGDWGLPG